MLSLRRALDSIVFAVERPEKSGRFQAVALLFTAGCVTRCERGTQRDPQSRHVSDANAVERARWMDG